MTEHERQYRLDIIASHIEHWQRQIEAAKQKLADLQDEQRKLIGEATCEAESS